MNVRQRSGSKSQDQSRPDLFGDRKRGDPNRVIPVSSPQTPGRFYRTVGARLHCRNLPREPFTGTVTGSNRALVQGRYVDRP